MGGRVKGQQARDEEGGGSRAQTGVNIFKVHALIKQTMYACAIITLNCMFFIIRSRVENNCTNLSRPKFVYQF